MQEMPWVVQWHHEEKTGEKGFYTFLDALRYRKELVKGGVDPEKVSLMKLHAN